MKATRLIPDPIKDRVKKSRLYIKHRSEAVNVYHCCVQKTASRWVKALLRDQRTFRQSGLRHHHYEHQQHFQPKRSGGHDAGSIAACSFGEPFPEGTIISPLYVDYPHFQAIPKPATYRAFFVTRDPRDILVSWYFSMRYSHKLFTGLAAFRDRLDHMSKEEGLRLATELLNETGLFDALRSWIDAPNRDSNVKIVAYEDLTGPDQRNVLARLFEHCTINMPDPVLGELIHDHAFERKAGRRKGEEDVHAHLRKGVAGDWKNHFDEDVKNAFKSKTGTLVVDLGYESVGDW